jgi:predicted RNA binding protein YcfA (HicA-like mRNA interferase family)
MLTNNKTLKGILKDATQQGWQFDRHKNHIKGKHPDGKTTTISVSPSDNRAFKNIVKDLMIK